MNLVEERGDEVSLMAGCDVLGVSRASLYRSRRPAAPPVEHARPPSPRRLGEAERKHLLDTLHQPEFADQPPAEVYATLLGRSVYLASVRTMYRVLAEVGETRERRNQRAAQVHARPSLTASAPNQVWTWDITKLATTHKGVFLLAYVIIDLFSRYVVGWMLATKECKHLAAQLFAESIARHGVEPGLTVHADRGSAMKSDTLAQLFASLGVSRSFSRPHVSDDNAFSEAQFKTLKYQPDYPGRLESELQARGYLQDFFGWHNDRHHHWSLALFTPADVFHGRVEATRATRQAALEAAYAAHPERFPHGPPCVRLPPAEVHINPLESSAVSVRARTDDATTGSRVGDARVAGAGAGAQATSVTSMDASAAGVSGASTGATGCGTGVSTGHVAASTGHADASTGGAGTSGASVSTGSASIAPARARRHASRSREDATRAPLAT